jgi:hypothetical protein
MKKAGDLLSVFFDEGVMKKAQGFSSLFSSWTAIVTENNIPTAAAQSRIKELEGSLLLVEADHPGWIQILQSKQRGILNAVRRRFPDLTIAGVSLFLSREPASLTNPAGEPHSGDPCAAIRAREPDPSTERHTGIAANSAGSALTGEAAESASSVENAGENASVEDLYERISDESFRDDLKRLEQSIISRSKSVNG